MDFNFDVLSYMYILSHVFYVGPDLMGFIRTPTDLSSFSSSKHNLQLILVSQGIFIQVCSLCFL